MGMRRHLSKAGAAVALSEEDLTNERRAGMKKTLSAAWREGRASSGGGLRVSGEPAERPHGVFLQLDDAGGVEEAGVLDEADG